MRYFDRADDAPLNDPEAVLTITFLDPWAVSAHGLIFIGATSDEAIEAAEVWEQQHQLRAVSLVAHRVVAERKS